MGDSRSWAYSMEDEEKTCRHGVVSKYFDKCTCIGCTQDRAIENNIAKMADKIRSAAYKALYSESPDRRDWRFNLYMKLINGVDQ